MNSSIIQLLKPPRVDDVELGIRILVLKVYLWFMSIVISPLILILILSEPPAMMRWLFTAGGLFIANGFGLILIKVRKFSAAAWFTLLLHYTIVTALCVTAGGIYANAIMWFSVIIISSGIILGQRGGLFFASLCLVTQAIMVMLSSAGLLQSQFIALSVAGQITHICINLLAIIMLFYLSTSQLSNALLAALAENHARRSAEDSLAASNVELQGILDSSLRVAIITTDTTGIIRSFSRGAELMLGYDAAEVVGRMTPLQFHDPAEIEVRRGDLGRDLGREFPSLEVLLGERGEVGVDEQTWTLLHRDGTRLSVQLAVNPLYGEGGRITGYTGTAVDVTDRVTAERKLTAERAFSDRLINSLPGIFYLYRFDDPDPGYSHLMRWNKDTLKLLGYVDEQYAQMRAIDFFEESNHDRLRELLTNLRNGGQAEMVADLRHADGHMITFLMRAEGFRDEGVDYFIGFGIDISARIRAEDERQAAMEELQATMEQLEETNQELSAALMRLAMSETRYRTLYDTVADGIFVVGEDGRFREVNRTACEQLGYDRDELIGMPVSAIATRDDFGIDEIIIRLRDRGQLIYETENLRKDGTKMPVEISLRFIETAGWRGILGVSHDITERRRAARELQALNERLADIIEFLPDPTFVIDEDKRVVAWNRATEILTGVKKEDILGKGDYAYAVPFWGERRPILIDFLDMSEEELLSAYKYIDRVDSMIYAESFIQRLNDGRGCHLWGVAAPLFDRQGRRTGAIEVIRDVSSLKQAEQELAASEARFRGVLEEVSHIAIQAYESDGTITFWNNASATIYGYERDEALGRSIFMLQPDEETRRAERAAMDEALRTRSTFPAEEVGVLDRRGRRRMVLASRILHDRPNREPEFFCFDVDITDRKRAEESLKQSERRLSLAISATADAIWDWNLDTGKTYYSPRWYQMLGYENEQMPMTFDAWKDLCHPDDYQDAIQKINAVLQDPASTGYNAEFRMRRADGTWMWIMGRGNVVERDASGRPLVVSGTNTDITAMREAQERVSKSLAEKEALLRELYHRTKNNMQVICGMLSLESSKSKDELRPVFNQIESKIRTMALVHQKLYESRDLTSINLVEYAGDLVQLILGSSVATVSRITADVAGEPLYMPIDTAIPLGLVLNELITNTVKHAFPGGVNGRIAIDISSHGDMATVRYQDTGAGLPDGITLEEVSGLGLRVIGEIVRRQLKGSLRFLEGPGFGCELMVKTALYERRV